METKLPSILEAKLPQPVISRNSSCRKEQPVAAMQNLPLPVRNVTATHTPGVHADIEGQGSVWDTPQREAHPYQTADIGSKDSQSLIFDRAIPLQHLLKETSPADDFLGTTPEYNLGLSFRAPNPSKLVALPTLPSISRNQKRNQSVLSRVFMSPVGKSSVQTYTHLSVDTPPQDPWNTVQKLNSIASIRTDVDSNADTARTRESIPWRHLHVLDSRTGARLGMEDKFYLSQMLFSTRLTRANKSIASRGQPKLALDDILAERFRNQKSQTAEPSPTDLEWDSIESRRCPFPDCGKVLCRGSYVKDHILLHTRERPHVCSINGCQKRYRWQSNLSRHRRNVHGFSATEAQEQTDAFISKQFQVD